VRVILFALFVLAGACLPARASWVAFAPGTNLSTPGDVWSCHRDDGSPTTNGCVYAGNFGVEAVCYTWDNFIPPDSYAPPVVCYSWDYTVHGPAPAPPAGDPFTPGGTDAGGVVMAQDNVPGYMMACAAALLFGLGVIGGKLR
jgi:hypothetical protein